MIRSQAAQRLTDMLSGPVFAVSCVFLVFVAGSALGASYAYQDGLREGHERTLRAVKARLTDLSDGATPFYRATYTCVRDQLTPDDLARLADEDNAQQRGR